jgi:nucleoside permease NupC
MPALIYFSAVVHVLAHFGLLNYLVLKISWLCTVILGTTPTESLVAIGSVFVGTVLFNLFFIY